MGLAPTQAIFPAIEAADLDLVRRLLDEDPGLVHVRHADPELHHWSPLQFAAAKGQLAACRLLVERGAEVYTNPMNTYPPVIQAAWNKHPEIVKYFLEEIPEKAEGTNRLGVAFNLAARQGWVDLVRKRFFRNLIAGKFTRHRVAGQKTLSCIGERFTRAVDTLRVWRNQSLAPSQCGCDRNPRHTGGCSDSCGDKLASRDLAHKFTPSEA